MAQISAMVSNGAMAQPTQCSPCLSKTRAARGSLAKSAATVSSAQLMSGARLIRVHPICCSIVDHRRYEVFVMAPQRAAGTKARYEAGKSSAMATSACALSRTTCWRPPLRMPRSSQELMSRLTVYSVVPVISAMS
jgi:hypothetical protein